MLMPLTTLVDKYDMKIRGVLHLGAHLAEEAPDYATVARLAPVWWVEANPRVIPLIERVIRPFIMQRVINALVTDVDGDERPFHVTNYDGMSSSVLEFGTHPQFSPDTVFVEHLTLPTRTVDSLVAEHDIEANFLAMDLQGAELMALRGADKFIAGVDYIVTEVNKAEVYIGCAQVGQLDEQLPDFERVETFWVGDQGWGDAAYCRRSVLSRR